MGVVLDTMFKVQDSGQSKIKHKESCPLSVLRPSVTLRVPPWNLKWAGLESSGQRQISSVSKTMRKAFYFGKKILQRLSDFLRTVIFEIFGFLDFFLHFWCILEKFFVLRIFWIFDILLTLKKNLYFLCFWIFFQIIFFFFSFFFFFFGDFLYLKKKSFQCYY